MNYEENDMLYRALSFIVCVVLILTLSSCNNQSTEQPTKLPDQQPNSHVCENECDTCGKCRNEACNEAECKEKCEKDHLNLPFVDVGDLK